jgi:hypothetical protein
MNILAPTKLRIVVVAVVILFLLSAMWVVAAPLPLWQLITGEPVRAGTDPLSDLEIARAQELAIQGRALTTQDSTADRVEILLVERHQEPKSTSRQGNWPRRADIYSYNYDTDMLTHVLVNLNTGVVEWTESAQNIQLPLSRYETSVAIRLALTDPATRAAIEAGYQQVMQEPLQDPLSQLKLHALIFRAEAMPDRVTEATRVCGLHRCAKLILSTPTDYLINVLPVVDLSRQQVTVVNFFSEE